MTPEKVHQIYETKPGARISRRLGEWLAGVSREHRAAGMEYKLWDNARQNDLFVGHHFPGWYEQYRSLPFDVQRWDILRLMILYIEGGIYIDTDVECYKSTLPLVENVEGCAFALEPQAHADEFRMPYLVGTYFIAAKPGDIAIYKLIEFLLARTMVKWSTHQPTQVMKSTGAFAVTEFLQTAGRLFNIALIDSRYTSPVAAKDIPDYLKGRCFEVVDEAYLVHLYVSSWAKAIENKHELNYQEYLRKIKEREGE